MLNYFFSTLPFEVCLFWFVVLAMKFRKNDIAKRMLAVFAGVCTVLYLCHAFYFLGHSDLLTETVWVFCSMSVYPLYYLYICRLTSSRLSPKLAFAILLPGFAVAALVAFAPSAAIELMRKIVFAGQVLGIFYFGQKRLRLFDRKLAEVYADTEQKSTERLQWLLVCFIATSATSAVISSIGRSFFLSKNAEEWQLVAIPSILFSIMLFALFYIGYTRHFTIEQYEHDNVETSPDVDTLPLPSESTMQQLGVRLDHLMKEEKMYLRKDLKIGDVANAVGVCRTYVSNYINQAHGCSFSDYINCMRIAHAKSLLLNGDENTKMMVIALESGFNNEQSFYRNFRKQTGLSPAEWVRHEQENHGELHNPPAPDKQPADSAS